MSFRAKLVKMPERQNPVRATTWNAIREYYQEGL
jgi:hypothetical protein